MAHDDQAPKRALAEEVTQGLARTAGAGDREAFAMLYERVGSALYSWVALRLPAPLRGVVGPEDVLQEVWMRALSSLTNYDPARGSFRRWMIQIAKHSLLDALRRQRAMKASPNSGARLTRTLEGVPDQVTSVTRSIARREDVSIFLRRVRSLSEPDATLLVLCGLQEVSVEDAARRLDLSTAAANKRWQRLRARLVAECWPAGFRE